MVFGEKVILGVFFLIRDTTSELEALNATRGRPAIKCIWRPVLIWSATSSLLGIAIFVG